MAIFSFKQISWVFLADEFVYIFSILTAEFRGNSFCKVFIVDIVQKLFLVTLVSLTVRSSLRYCWKLWNFSFAFASSCKSLNKSPFRNALNRPEHGFQVILAQGIKAFWVWKSWIKIFDCQWIFSLALADPSEKVGQAVFVDSQFSFWSLWVIPIF